MENITCGMKVLDIYSKLLNSYVLDFFTEKHWDKLSRNWQESLKDLDPHQLAELLNYEHSESSKQVWPLSILALKSILRRASLSRRMVEFPFGDCPFAEETLITLFWKNVKAKKRHEISILSKICYKFAKEDNCNYIIDIGSGLGHLSRMLCYGYGLAVCSIEAKESLSFQARVLDVTFEQVLRSKTSSSPTFRIAHVNTRINSNITLNDFLKVIQSGLNLSSLEGLRFGIVGLHPCGDLTPTLLRLYSLWDKARFISVASCCYMKLSTSCPNQGFPLSQFCLKNNYSLSYHSREVACHAIEKYRDRLNQGESWSFEILKIHTYRALLEKIVCSIEPNLRHSHVNNVKYSEDLSFEAYCTKAISRHHLSIIPEHMLTENKIKPYLDQWRNVIAFYSMRLFFAPLVESVILLDRLLYVQETGSDGDIIAVFDPRISPRNNVLMAKKR